MTLEAGLALLQASDLWVDAEESTLTTVDIDGYINLRGTPAINTATLANIVGPEGELGVSVSETAATAIFQVLCAPPANFSYGYHKITHRYLTTEQCDKDINGAVTQRWKTAASSNSASSGYAYLRPPSTIDDPTSGPLRQLSASVQAYSAKQTRVIAGQDWLDVELATQAAGVASNFLFGLSHGAPSKPGTSALIVSLASIRMQQRRVAAIGDVRDGTIRFSESTNSARQCLAPDLWGGHPCFIESQTNGTLGLTPLTNAAVTPETFTILVKCWRNNPTTAGTVIRVGDVSAKVGTNSTWHIVQGATDVDTGYQVGSLSVALTLSVQGGTASLYVDGQLVGSAAMTQGGTGIQIGGGMAEVWWYGASAGSNYTTEQISQIALAMRWLGHLPAIWPLCVLAGQSNATDGSTGEWLKTGAMSPALHGVGSYANMACIEQNWGGGGIFVADLWGNGAPNQTTIAPISSGQLGVSTGWYHRAAQEQRSAAFLLCGKGGEPISSWADPAGVMRLWTQQAIDHALDSAGTHLIELRKWVWVQGAAEPVSGADTYLTNLNTVRDWLIDRYGTQVQWIGLRLSEYVGTLPGFEFADDVRAAQDAFEAQHPESVIHAIPSADPADFNVGDPVHYKAWYRPTIGGLMFDADVALNTATATLTEKIPQPRDSVAAFGTAFGTLAEKIPQPRDSIRGQRRHVRAPASRTFKAP